MLELEDIQAGYGRVDVLHGVSLQARAGQITTLVGANGAGKTTLLMCISGLIPVTKGRIQFLGQDITRLKPHEIVRIGLVQSPEGRKIFPRMTVAENLAMGAFLRRDKEGISKQTRHIYELFPILAQRRSQAAGTLSGGEQQMLAIGRAMLARPKLLLLDEPSLGLAPLIVKQIFEVVKHLNAHEDVTVLLVEQNARMALKLAHQGYVMETGKIAMTDSASALLEDPRVQSLYLGG